MLSKVSCLSRQVVSFLGRFPPTRPASAGVQNDFVLQVRDLFLNIFIFDKSEHVWFMIMDYENKGGRGGGGRAVCGREGNCHGYNELC